MKNTNDNEDSDRPSTSELLGTAPEQIKRQGQKEDQEYVSSQPEQGGVYELFVGSASIILLILGLIALGAWLITTDFSPDEPEGAITPSSFIYASTKQEVELASTTDISQAVTKHAPGTLQTGTFSQLYFTHINDGQKELVSGSDFLNRLTEGSLPLARYVGNSFMYGTYAASSNSPYIIFSIRDYDGAYGAILQNEADFKAALEEINFPSVARFSDTIIQNQDVRIAKGESGQIYYSFPRQGILVVTTSEDTLRTIFSRLRQG